MDRMNENKYSPSLAFRIYFLVALFSISGIEILIFDMILAGIRARCELPGALRNTKRITGLSRLCKINSEAIRNHNNRLLDVEGSRKRTRPECPIGFQNVYGWVPLGTGGSSRVVPPGPRDLLLGIRQIWKIFWPQLRDCYFGCYPCTRWGESTWCII